MKNKNILFAVVLLAVLVFTPAAFAQTTTVQTLLTAAVTDTNATLFTVSSTSSITAATASLAQYCFIDNELLYVRAIPASGTIQVRRGEGSTVPALHPNSSIVTCGLAGVFDPKTGNTSGVFIRGGPTVGSTCVVATQAFSFVINPLDGTFSRCNASSLRWETTNYVVDGGPNGLVPIVDPGDAAYTATLQDYHIVYRQASTGRTVTLPSVTNIWGKTLIISQFTTGTYQTITVAAPNGQLINGAASNTFLASTTPGGSLRLRSFNGGWVTW